MFKTCKICHNNFELTGQDLELFKKLEVPISDICPEDRHKAKMIFRNESVLFKRKCDLCGNKIISMFSPKSDFTVFCNKCWWSDKWDPMEYARDYDFNRTFFEQADEFNRKVPKCALDNFDHENSEYCNFACHNKDCYMIFGSWFSEKCMYGNTVLESLKVLDSLYVDKSQYCYELIDCDKCYNLFFSQNCSNCRDSMFLFDCRNTENSLFCWNLRNKKYHIFNKPVLREEFEKARNDILGEHGKIKDSIKHFRDLINHSAIHKYMEGEKNENSSGNYLYGCKNANDVFYGMEIEDVTHSIRTVKNQKDSMFINGNSGGELMYDSINCDFCRKGQFNIGGERNTDFTYCWYCFQCGNVFACSSLRHKKYCIFNKQYSKEDYLKLKEKIITHMKETGEWGYFFPAKMSPFNYEETIAGEYFPLETEKSEKISGEIPVFDYPETIDETDESILEVSLPCKKCGKEFRLNKAEFDFYKKFRLPVPHFCFSCRHMRRMKTRAPYKSFQRTCGGCGSSLITSLDNNFSEKVFCDECYREKIY